MKLPWVEWPGQLEDKMKGDAPLWHRNNHKWTQEEIDALIDMRLVQFVPASYATRQPRLKPQRQMTLQKRLAAKFDESFLVRLDALADELLPLEITDEGLETKLRREIVKLIPSNAVVFVVPENEDPLKTLPIGRRDQKLWDLTLVLNASDYLRVSLGLYPRSRKGIPRADWERNSRRRRIDQMAKTTQLSCVQEWTETYEDVWSDPIWRECLSIRYEMGNPRAIDLLSKKTRSRLDKAAKRLKKENAPNGPTLEQIESASNGDDETECTRFSLGVLRFDYLVTVMAGELNKTHRLRKPAHYSGLFVRIATLQAESHNTPSTRSNYIERFCRYLTIPPGHPNELIGRLIVRLLKIESDYWERQPDDKENPPKSVRLPKLRRDEMAASDDFKLIADRISTKLGIDRRMFSRLWADWCGIKLGHFWQKRAASKYTAYWLANVLENEHNDVFRIYCKWIECFQVEILRPLLRSRSVNEIGVKKAAIGPFHAALLGDPLLQSVLHYEVFKGKAELAPPRWKPKRDENGPIKLIVAHAYRVLLKAYPETPKVSIEAILRAEELENPCVRTALRRTERDQNLGGFSHFAYVAPLVTAMINEDGTVINRDMAKDIHRRNKASHLLGELESEPDRFLTRIIRGETPL